MYAIVQISSEQFKVSQGDVVTAPKIDKENGQDIELDQVLLLDDGKDVKIGQPFLKGVTVTAKILGQEKADKVVAFKFRRRKNYAKTIAHRQKLTELQITAINA